MTSGELAGLLEEKRREVEAGLSRWLPSAGERPARLHEAMRYSLQAGGKRLRPVLVLLAGELYPSRAEALPAAVAVECVHTYSLIHDDLPAMDDASLRRGLPSCHAKYGEALAILAGDALLTEAFAILARGYAGDAALAREQVETLARAAGSRRLIAGQTEDILGEARELSAQELEGMHQGKTAAMIEASLQMGLRTTEAPASAYVVLEGAGRAAGLAFQVVDDVLDATASEQELGKATGQDAARAKNTYVKLFGLEGARTRAKELTEEALRELGRLGERAEKLRALISSLAGRTR